MRDAQAWRPIWAAVQTVIQLRPGGDNCGAHWHQTQAKPPERCAPCSVIGWVIPSESLSLSSRLETITAMWARAIERVNCYTTHKDLLLNLAENRLTLWGKFRRGSNSRIPVQTLHSHEHLSLLCMYVYVCLEVCADECGCLQRPEEDISSSRDAVTLVTAP